MCEVAEYDITDVFKTYDIRGKINLGWAHSGMSFRTIEAIAKGFKLAFPEYKKLVVGHDTRPVSEDFADVFIKAIGGSIILLGTCTSEEAYYAAQYGDAAVMFTASHNSIEYCGIKFAHKNGAPFNAEEMSRIRNAVKPPMISEYYEPIIHTEYLNKVLDLTGWKEPSSKILVNCNQGSMVPLLKELGADNDEIPLLEKGNRLIFTNTDIDAFSVDWEPNPTKEKVRKNTSFSLIASKSDYAVMFDGDGDRFVVVAPDGHTVEAHYTGALIAEYLAQQGKCKSVVHGINYLFNIQDVAKRNNLHTIECCTGHVFMKNIMRVNDAEYGFEFSGHNYFKELNYIDSGLMAFLYFDQIPNKFERLTEMEEKFPCSGELNFKTKKEFKLICGDLLSKYRKSEHTSDNFDGFSMEFPEWRFNIRKSGTEDLIRLSIESRKNECLIEEKINEIFPLIG